jgi:hypothetical protein
MRKPNLAAKMGASPHAGRARPQFCRLLNQSLTGIMPCDIEGFRMSNGKSSVPPVSL